MRARPRHRLACFLVIALLVAQWLGVVHRAAHAATPACIVPAVATVEAEDHSGRWLESLFGEHREATPDCLLLDQLAHADTLPGAAPPAAPPLPSPEVASAARLEPRARCSFHFHARGPPAFR